MARVGMIEMLVQGSGLKKGRKEARVEFRAIAQLEQFGDWHDASRV